jgi:hypothetical protein
VVVKVPRPQLEQPVHLAEHLAADGAEQVRSGSMTRFSCSSGIPSRRCSIKHLGTAAGTFFADEGGADAVQSIP